MKWISGVIGVGVFAVAASLGVSAQQNQMTFFVTSAGPGNGANLGGLAGADKHCQTLAAAAGAGNRTWRAYLSAAAANGQPAVNAKDRIGKGPWTNVKGVVVAKSVADLHSDANNLNGDTALSEKGAPVPGNQHDILTGSQKDGTITAGQTCGDWTATTGMSAVGHADGLGPNMAATGNFINWTGSHTGQCSDTAPGGGAGKIYCFVGP